MLGNFDFAYGQEVVMHSLSSDDLNGQHGIVLPKSHSAKASEAWDKGRVPVLYRPSGGVATSTQFVGVHALPGDRVLSVKPANLGRYGLKNKPGGEPYKLGERLYWECSKGGAFDPASTCDISVVQDLIKRGADVHWEHPTNGADVLHHAAGQPNVDVIKLLLEEGADPNAAGGALMGALHSTAGNSPAAVKLLLQYGAKTVTDEPMMMGLNGSLIGYARNHVKAIKSATKKKELLECIALMEKAEEENARA